MVYSLETVFKFGKFKGKTLREAIKDDFKTIRWYRENNDNFKMDEESTKFYLDLIKNFGSIPR
jgi:hypothetical protein